MQPPTRPPWTLDKPAASGDRLREVFVVQLAAFLERLTLRHIIAFIQSCSLSWSTLSASPRRAVVAIIKTFERETQSDCSQVRLGSTTDLTALKADFRFTPESRLRADIRACPKSANSGLMHRSKRHARTAVIYSITSSARASSDGRTMCLGGRSSDGSAHLRPRRAARRRLEPVLAHSARAITPAHRAPLIITTPHSATRMAVRATVDTTRSHAGAPVRDGLRLINA
jgi:hypothetical protein